MCFSIITICNYDVFAGRQPRPASAAPRGGRGRNRGGRRANYNRPANRLPSEPDYPDYPTDYTQLPKFGAAIDGFLVPYMGTFFYNSSNYLNNSNLKDYIKKQIEYYFSEENLERDFFMRRKMDAEGYLPVTLIASFNRVQGLTNDLTLVVEAINDSDKLELSNGFKVRTKHEPTKWPIREKGSLGQPPVKIGPLVTTIKDTNSENLNPNVAEFVPQKDKADDKSSDEKSAEEEKSWREVKRKTKESKGKKETKVKSFEREELEFHFDEELDEEVPTGRQNTFSTEWLEDETDELSDRDVNKLLIVTQATTRAPKHEGYDRTGDWTTRVKMSQELVQAINDGLYYYEEDLWVALDHDRPASGSYKTVTVVSQEVFEKLAPPAPKKQNPEVPPPPPPPLVPQPQASGSGNNKKMCTPAHRNVPRFYAVVKDNSPDPRTPRKRKTRHSNNPPVEHHVGWIMDVKEHRHRTTSAG